MTGKATSWLTELRFPLLAFGATLIAGVSIVTADLYLADRRDDQLMQAQRRLQSVQLSVGNVQREAANLAEFHARYQELAARGVFGDERRLDWIDLMNSASGAGYAASLDYEIGQRRSLQVADVPEARNVEILASRVLLKGSFLHEGRLADFLALLRDSQAGSYRIDNCVIRRAAEKQESDARANLKADCRLEWITLKPRSEAPR